MNIIKRYKDKIRVGDIVLMIDWLNNRSLIKVDSCYYDSCFYGCYDCINKDKQIAYVESLGEISDDGFTQECRSYTITSCDTMFRKVEIK